MDKSRKEKSSMTIKDKVSLDLVQFAEIFRNQVDVSRPKKHYVSGPM